MNPGTSGGNNDERTPIDFMEALQIFIPRDKDISFLKSRRRELSEKAHMNHTQKPEAEAEKIEREALLKVKRQQREERKKAREEKKLKIEGRKKAGNNNPTRKSRKDCFIWFYLLPEEF